MPKQICDDAQTLIKQTIILVNAEPRGPLAVSIKTGVPYYWLRKFSSEKIANPSVNRVQYLYEKLSGNKLLKK